MQNTSSTWKTLWATGTAMLETKAVIAGTEYTRMSNPIITRALSQNGLSIGNAVSATCQFSVIADPATIPKAAEIQIQMRLTDGTTYSEWLPAGTYYIAHRHYDRVSGILTLDCYDALLKANANPPQELPWTDHLENAITNNKGEWIYFVASYPRQMADVALDLALIMGTELDPRTVISTGAEYVIETPETGATIHDLLGLIARANCGNWIISPAGKLRLVPVLSAANAESATSNVIDLLGVTAGIGTHTTATVTGVRYTQNDGQSIVLGADSGLVVDAGEVSYTLASAIYNRMRGMTYQAYTLSGALYDPAAEVGDYVRGGANGEIRGVLFSEVANLSELFHADISAPETGEMSDEYPYIGQAVKTLAAAKQYASGVAEQAEENAKEYADSATETLNESLNQEAIFNRLTNNGQVQGLYMQDGKVYLNATYMQTGTMSADRINGGTLTLGGVNNKSGKLIVYDETGVYKLFELDNWGLVLYGKTNMELSAPSYININDSNADNRTVLQSSGFATYIRYNETNQSMINTIDITDTIISSTDRVACINVNYTNSNTKWYSHIDPARILFIKEAKSSDVEYEGDELSASFGVNGLNLYRRYNDETTNYFIYETASGLCEVSGTFRVRGTKSRRVTTDQYSDRLLYCYETPSPLFGDVGEGVIGEDGYCYVAIDAIFADTITTNQYQVFLQKYGQGDCWIAERKGGYFVVQGTPGLAFGWEMKAKQKDFDQLRLDNAAEPFVIPTQTYGEDAAQYIDEIRKERENA